MSFGEPVEHNVGKSFFLVLRQQAAKNGIAVESRNAPPDEPPRGIDERRGATIADHGEVQPLRPLHAINPATIGISSSDRAPGATDI